MSDQIKMLLEKTAPFTGFSSGELEDLARHMTVSEYPASAVILGQSNTEHMNLYLVVSGEVKIIEATTGHQSRTFGEGKFFGHYGLLQGGALPHQVETISETKLAIIPADVFEQLCARHPRVLAFFESDISVYTRHHLTLFDLSGAQFLFGTRLRDLVRQPPPQCKPDASVQAAAKIMSEMDCDYLLVIQGGTAVGLITDSLLRKQIVAAGISQETPVSAIMNSELVFLTERNSLYEALLKMIEFRLSQIIVRSSNDDSLIAVVSDRDIARSHGYNPMLLFQQAEQATTVSQLSDLRLEANYLLLQLYKRGVRAQDLITINTMINDSLTGRVLALSQSAIGCSAPDLGLKWAWLSLGSEGRGEMGLKTDQDNALVFKVSNDETNLVDEWLSSWTEHANQSLDQIGLTLCEGDMMARNPIWRLPVVQWEQQFQDWMAQSKANRIMQISAACDLRAVHGDLSLEKPIKHGLRKALHSNSRFLKFMAQGVTSSRPPLSQFTRRIRTRKTDQGEMINIKRQGLQPITDFARILCLQAGYLDSSNTFDRLQYLQSAIPEVAITAGDALEAYRHINDIRFGHQLQAVANGSEADNWISVDKLSDTQRQMLKAAFSAIEIVQGKLAQRFGLFK